MTIEFVCRPYVGHITRMCIVFADGLYGQQPHNTTAENSEPIHQIVKDQRQWPLHSPLKPHRDLLNLADTSTCEPFVAAG